MCLCLSLTSQSLKFLLVSAQTHIRMHFAFLPHGSLSLLHIWSFSRMKSFTHARSGFVPPTPHESIISKLHSLKQQVELLLQGGGEAGDDAHEISEVR